MGSTRLSTNGGVDSIWKQEGILEKGDFPDQGAFTKVKEKETVITRRRSRNDPLESGKGVLFKTKSQACKGMRAAGLNSQSRFYTEKITKDLLNLSTEPIVCLMIRSNVKEWSYRELLEVRAHAVIFLNYLICVFLCTGEGCTWVLGSFLLIFKTWNKELNLDCVDYGFGL
ncbi:hypothetical protein HA466_0287570 [Hirschfeldia incana]|nr:hypothetical protein HA466_0287570 [Hirschfeldia incana]